VKGSNNRSANETHKGQQPTKKKTQKKHVRKHTMQENQKKLGPIYKITWYIWFEAVMF
jgi:hypothetical protein